jgi:hypothetical protein
MHPAVQLAPRDVPPCERSTAVPAFTCPFGQISAPVVTCAPTFRSTCISRRSRPAGTSVLTLAQRVHGCSRSEVPFYRARSRSTFTHMFSHTFAVTAPFDTSTSFDAETFRSQHPGTSFAFRRQPSRSVAHPSIFPIPFGTRLQHLSASTSRGAA